MASYSITDDLTSNGTTVSAYGLWDVYYGASRIGMVIETEDKYVSLYNGTFTPFYFRDDAYEEIVAAHRGE